MIKTIIAAHDPNLVIGKDGELPWHFSEDLKFFKQTTLGHPLLMGRKVFEEIGEKPLPGREAIVLSKSKSYANVPVFNNLDDAFAYLSDKVRIFIIGGGDVYRQTIDIADELIITEIHKTYEGDTFFPDYREDVGTVWEEVSRDDRENLSFVKYVRKS